MSIDVEGIDVSVAQATGSISWREVAGAGVSFMYAKATEGVNYGDPAFKGHVAGAKAAGLATGAYHYLHVRLGRPQDADTQADQFCDAYLAAGCELLPMLDCEPTGNDGCTPAEWLTAIRLFVATVQSRLNVAPIIYTYPSFWSGLGNTLGNAADIGALVLWIAQYTHSPEPIVPEPWRGWSVWQYAADVGVIGQVAGVPGHVDRDRLAPGVTLQDLMRVQMAPVVPRPAPIPPQVTQVPPEPVAVVEPPAPVKSPPAVTSTWQAIVAWILSIFAPGKQP